MESRSRNWWERSTKESAKTPGEIKREEWEARQHFANKEAICGRCLFDSDEEGHWFVLDFEAVKRVKIGRRTARSRLD